ncbi:MAG: pyrroloquinoline quinone-dependent dehydrogenase [Fimbriimonadaceae bacterium]
MLSVIIAAAVGQSTVEWPAYGNDPGGMRYSTLAAIDKSHVKKLKVAWTYRHGDIADERGQPKSSFESTPIMVGGTLYFSTPFSRVIALNAATGEHQWSFDPKINRRRPIASEPLIHRGVAAWRDSKTGQRRIFIGTYDARLFALDAASGKPLKDFGDAGMIDLKKGLRRVIPGEYQIAQPPTVIGDIVVMGSTIGDNNEAEASSGTVRAFDARTGELVWSFEPFPGGAANAWAVMSADPATGTVFIPTSSPSPDYFGGLRPGNNADANSLVALNAKTGRVKWRYQVVRHDVWDYDIPAQPILCTIRRIPAVVILTKMGFVFVLDRRTGKPISPVADKVVPASKVPGEKLSRTQPVPKLPAPLVPQKLAGPFGNNPQELEAARAQIGRLPLGKLYDPPSLAGTIQYPGAIGGCNWSGGAFDPATTTLYVNTNNVPTLVRLIPRDKVPEYLTENPGAAVSKMAGAPYVLARNTMLTPDRLPINPPPWGVLTTVDLTSGKLRWQKPLGFVPKLAANPLAKKWGSPNFGGAIVTKGGLVFIAAAQDNIFRAFDAASGKVLWEYELPAGGNATPMTYSVGGRQYVVICAGGHSGLDTKRGDYVIAFALPQ